MSLGWLWLAWLRLVLRVFAVASAQEVGNGGNEVAGRPEWEHVERQGGCVRYGVGPAVLFREASRVDDEGCRVFLSLVDSQGSGGGFWAGCGVSLSQVIEDGVEFRLGRLPFRALEASVGVEVGQFFEVVIAPLLVVPYPEGRGQEFCGEAGYGIPVAGVPQYSGVAVFGWLLYESADGEDPGENGPLGFGFAVVARRIVGHWFWS